MAKTYFGKLDLSKNTDIKTFTWNEQVIEVKQYLPIQEKTNLIVKILNEAIDEKVRYYLPWRLEVFFTVNLFFTYTNISITDKQIEDAGKVYDMLISSGIYNEFINNMDTKEYSFINHQIHNVIDKMDAYTNSVYGILDNMNEEYGDISEGAKQLLNDLSESKDIELVSDIMTKLG
jgi:hypothetical protein